MEGVVKGEAVVFKVDTGSGLQPFACARSITINLKADFIGKSTIGSGDWKEKEVAALDWDFTCEGVTWLAKTGFEDAATMIDVWLAGGVVNVSFIVTDTESNTFSLTGNAIIPNISLNGAVDNVSSTQLTGEGTGELVKT